MILGRFRVTGRTLGVYTCLDSSCTPELDANWLDDPIPPIEAVDEALDATRFRGTKLSITSDQGILDANDQHVLRTRINVQITLVTIQRLGKLRIYDRHHTKTIQADDPESLSRFRVTRRVVPSRPTDSFFGP